jgi:3-oxoacyl-[acyl-carrier protein] reductase
LDHLIVGNDGRDALVAGAATPVGAAIAQRLAADGFNLTSQPGPLDVAVFASVEPDSLTWRPLVQVDEDGFARWCERPMRDFVQWLQSIHPRVRERNGTVVLVAPTVSQEGATGLVSYGAAVEGQRLLAKSAARQWASDGITVLIVAPRLDVVARDGGTSTIEPSDAGRTKPVLDAASYDASAVARVVSMLVASAPSSHALSGSTIAVDGGALMAP